MPTLHYVTFDVDLLQEFKSVVTLFVILNFDYKSGFGCRCPKTLGVTGAFLYLQDQYAVA